MPTQPNIVFIIADDHRFDALGCNGDATVQTPNLDALAASGTNFTRAHMMGGLTGAVCVPTRAMLHTGQGTFHTSVSTTIGDTDGLATLRHDNILLGEALRNVGYHSFGIGKWHNDAASFNRSFDDGAAIFMGGMHDQWETPVQDYDSSGQYKDGKARVGGPHSTDVFCDAAVGFLNEYKSERPFFLYVALTSPHDPRTAPAYFHELYDADEMPLPASFRGEHPFDNGDLHNRDEELAGFPRTPAEIRRHSADYYAMISHQDARIGDILQTLSERGLAENTIVIYTSDHGLAVGRHGLMGKQNLYEHSVRVPLLMRGPGVPSSHAADALLYTFDLYPTLLQMAGGDVAAVDGQSLLPILKGEATQHRESVGAVYLDIQRMWSDGEWKIIRYFVGANGRGTERVQLFDLTGDPHELHDLSSDPAQAARVQTMLEKLSDWQRENDDILN